MTDIVYHRHKLYIRVISATVSGSQQVCRKPVHFYRCWCMGSRGLKECKACALTFQAQWLSYVPPELTFRYSTFCPQNAVCILCGSQKERVFISRYIINPLNAELNPICHLLALLGAHHILHVSRIRVNWIVFIAKMKCAYCAVRL
jgi:hypothetical protein